MAVPYTAGKNSIASASHKGHTSRGTGLDAGQAAPATSKRNNRHADLATRNHGMGNDKRK